MKTCTTVKCKNQFVNTCGISISASNMKMSMYKNQCKEAVAQTCSVKKVFLEISQNSQENTCARVSILIKLQA